MRICVICASSERNMSASARKIHSYVMKKYLKQLYKKKYGGLYRIIALFCEEYGETFLAEDGHCNTVLLAKTIF